ncbi:MAG: hypothetical protein H0U79_06285, partial [Solirubrobacterales bacterium]|nr:hypothetical protein [Solirubrobacterales bacterium]
MSRLTPLQRAAIGDVLLGEGDVSDREQLEDEPDARAWAFAVAPELAPIDGGRLLRALAGDAE